MFLWLWRHISVWRKGLKKGEVLLCPILWHDFKAVFQLYVGTILGTVMIDTLCCFELVNADWFRKLSKRKKTEMRTKSWKSMETPDPPVEVGVYTARLAWDWIQHQPSSNPATCITKGRETIQKAFTSRQTWPKGRVQPKPSATLKPFLSFSGVMVAYSKVMEKDCWTPPTPKDSLGLDHLARILGGPWVD